MGLFVYGILVYKTKIREGINLEFKKVQYDSVKARYRIFL